jgi:hypothetical protein
VLATVNDPLHDFLKGAANETMGDLSAGRVSVALIVDFLKKIQRESGANINRLLTKHGVKMNDTKASVPLDIFSTILRDGENCLFKDEPHDMTQPLGHYWIASSHNT